MSGSAHDYLLVVTTAGSDAQAQEIASAVVERRLAACVNILHQVCSVYRWEGKIVDEGEALLLIKTHRSRFEALRAAIRELHSYEVPEIVAIRLEDGDPSYLAWLGKCAAEEPA